VNAGKIIILKMNIMSINHKINKCIRIICVLLFGLAVTTDLSAQRKTDRAASVINVSLIVVDDNGSPIPNANIVIGEGLIHAITDENGEFSFSAFPSEVVTITAPGFEKNASLVQDLLKDKTIRLKRSKLFMTSEDEVPLPYTIQKKRHLTGSTTLLKGDILEKYPSIDLRNAFTGIVPGLHVIERDGSTGISPEEKLGNYDITEKIEVSARGRDMVYVIDDMPVDITEMTLDPQEIETVTVIKDILGKSMYGPIGANGIIYIKTKRGRANERILNVNAEYGISVIDRFPGWVSGSDYAILNNQARKNDGLSENYSLDDITAYKKNDPYDMYHPSIDFKEMLIKNTKSMQRANVSSSGGSDMVQYYAYLGYSGEGDIYKLGSVADYNRLNTRSNINIALNDFFDLQFDIAAGLSVRRSPNYGYTSTTGEGGSQMDLIEFNSIISDIRSIPPVAFPVYANTDPELKSPWYGVSSIYRYNPVANITQNGYYNETGRKASSKISLIYKPFGFIEGFKSQTTVNFDALSLIRKGRSTDYNAYIVTPSDGTIKLIKVHDGVDNPSLLNLHDYYYLTLSFSESLSYEKKFGNSDIQSTLTYFLYRNSINGIEEPRREQSGAWSGKYTFNDKYTFQVLLNYTGTPSYAKSKRNGFFPSAGAGWIISGEDFMSGFKFIDFLKLRAEAGILGYERWLTPHYNLDNYTRSTGSVFGPYTANTWFGTNQETSPYIAYPNRIGNPDLTWEKRKEFSIGIDGLMFDKRLSFDVSYYNNLLDGLIVQVTNALPYIAGYSSALPWLNYNATRYFGLESSIQYTGYSGQLRYSFGANASVQNSKIEKYDEPAYRFAYQTREGKAADTYWGQTYLGKFTSDAEALEVPQLFDEVLKQGDLKYKDMNGDGVIDDNDQSAIGHASPRLYYSLNVSLDYKNFGLHVIGTGFAFYDLALTNEYYWNGWGDNNYSNFVRDNIGGAYPRLTYYKVNNNFISSDFWLTRGDYFKVQNIELTYIIPAKKLQIIRSQGMRIFLRGANLFTISGVKDVDPESISSGVRVYPLFRTFTGGFKLTF
jgi:TonB-linked SusC/RagA family outer membrane protein